jgi:[ribosomal protein S5]-alanine N-acetyltransferase
VDGQNLRLETERLVLRPWCQEDAEALVRHADNRRVWINLRDLFPHPYTLNDAHEFILMNAVRGGPPMNLAIEHAGEAIGGIGLHPLSDVARFTAEVGYWIGETFWGRGLAAEALLRFTEYAFEQFQYERLEGWIFTSNPASARVLEKAGYALEATLRRSAFKDGRFLDCHLYVRFRPR